MTVQSSEYLSSHTVIVLLTSSLDYSSLSTFCPDPYDMVVTFMDLLGLGRKSVKKQPANTIIGWPQEAKTTVFFHLIYYAYITY